MLRLARGRKVSHSKRIRIAVVNMYLVKGYTQMKIDSLHSAIERKLNYTLIYVPLDYVNIFLRGCKVPTRYSVSYLDFPYPPPGDPPGSSQLCSQEHPGPGEEDDQD